MPQNYRRCVSCRKLNHRSSFWRIVRVFPSHQLQLDQGMGRSVYLCPEANCLKLAQKKDRLGRSLKLTVPESLYQTLWLRLTQLEMQPLEIQLDASPEKLEVLSGVPDVETDVETDVGQT